MTSPLGLNDTQTGYARGIVIACQARNLPDDQGQRVADIALATALTESGLRMYANANNPESLQHAHDAVGHDHGSVGLFQQQVTGAPNSTAHWGTTSELMDPVVSTRKFLDRLLQLTWIPMTNWGAAQAVQNSAFDDGSNYRKNDARAIAIRKALWGSSPASVGQVVVAPPVGSPGPAAVHVVAPGDTLFAIARAWGTTLQAVEAANPTAGHPAGHFDVIRPGDLIAHP